MKKVKGQIKEKNILNNKGITLIALVITIVALIILAGVAINLSLSEDGIFSKAKQAKETYMQATNEEKIGIINLEDELESNIGINSYLKKFKAGDYVKYDTGISSVGTNGVIECRVLYESSSEYGLQIISSKTLESIILGGTDWETGKKSYNNAIKALNDNAEKYINADYAIDARCVGSNPKNKNIEVISTKILPPDEWSSYIRPSGWIDDNTGCKETDENYVQDWKIMQELNILDIKESYWLAYRIIGAHSTGCDFHIRSIDSNGNLAGGSNCGIGNGGQTGGYLPENKFRVCFTLKPEIKILQGDGKSEATAYILGK